MAVYTSLSHTQLQSFLHDFPVGELLSFHGIEAGIENSNYFVTTTEGRYVLTLFEHLQPQRLEVLIGLAAHLGQQLKVPTPIANAQGQMLHRLQNKPALLCSLLAGVHIQQPTPEHCFAIGQALAEFHLQAQSFTPLVEDPYHFSWWKSQGRLLVASLPSADQALYFAEIEDQQQHLEVWQSLPQGWIHADLFHDNALWEENHFAILDLYAACRGAYIYDLAVLANDWCCDVQGHWRSGCLPALMAGYQSRRTLQASEQQAWNLALTAAALRWWLGRLESQLFQAQAQGDLALSKNPNEYKQKLSYRRSAPSALFAP